MISLQPFEICNPCLWSCRTHFAMCFALEILIRIYFLSFFCLDLLGSVYSANASCHGPRPLGAQSKRPLDVFLFVFALLTAVCLLHAVAPQMRSVPSNKPACPFRPVFSGVYFLCLLLAINFEVKSCIFKRAASIRL